MHGSYEGLFVRLTEMNKGFHPDGGGKIKGKVFSGMFIFTPLEWLSCQDWLGFHHSVNRTINREDKCLLKFLSKPNTFFIDNKKVMLYFFTKLRIQYLRTPQQKYYILGCQPLPDLTHTRHKGPLKWM